MRAAVNLVLGALALTYPLAAMLLVRVLSPAWLVAALAATLLLRLILGGRGAPAVHARLHAAHTYSATPCT